MQGVQDYLVLQVQEGLQLTTSVKYNKVVKTGNVSLDAFLDIKIQTSLCTYDLKITHSSKLTRVFHISNLNVAAIFLIGAKL